MASDLHAYGPVNLDKARQEFRQQIDAIRSVCLQFENEVLGDVMKMGAGADPAFRKHFTHLKEQAALESTVRKVKDALKQTKDHLEQCVTEREESRLKKSIKSLERIAQGMGLVTFVDSSQTSESGVPLTTLTLGGTVIVVDIDMDDTGHVLKTKVTYVSEILQNDHDDRLDRMLAEILRTEDYDLFRRNLGTLALLDRLNVKYTPTNFFLLTRGLVADMRSICSQEALLVSGDMGTILMEGHGVPSLYLDYPGLSIAYWIDKKSMLDTDWESVRKSVENGDKHTALRPAAKLNISFEASEQSHYFLPPSRTRYLLSLEETEDYILEGENGKHMKILRETACPKFMQPMRFIKVLSTHPEAAAIPVRMVATLDPPLPASDTIIQSLMRITGYKKQGKFGRVIVGRLH
ncbi:uncharacterized protein BYT42DRAFT_497464 [Radiomyces spectabilis]|uniref:uncharacterized protein n=1 Tax=Radiomyces spectabilis TaxID=64574 RepID=UPI00221EC7C3|nr:uncharacterized protein BYT42DRAFT_497464 [Radiomyces spectabilis]KAI8377586.1 hypothetical protein BYT42DRAFT_497464 [Radiomyces spectabilis]